MKKLARNIERFDVFELFAAMAEKHGYRLNDPLSQEDFIAKVRSSLEDSKNNDITIYGKRVEVLFAYVVGALGRAILLKQEDAGALYHTEDVVIPPDYRLVLEDGSNLLVEVKNFYSIDITENFIVKADYYEKLNRYSMLCGLSLKFAIYFSAVNRWALVPIDAFRRNSNSYNIDFATAMAKSEMSQIGDCMIGTSPDLELLLLADEEEANEISRDGQALFTTRDIKIYCAGNEVVEPLEKQIAFYLMRFGNWVEKETEAIVKAGKLMGMKFIYTPESKTEENFSLIASLSSMVTNMFKEHTIQDGKVVAVSSHLDPEKFRVFIPNDYKGKELPLWRFIIQPNQEFKGLTMQMQRSAKSRTR